MELRPFKNKNLPRLSTPIAPSDGQLMTITGTPLPLLPGQKYQEVINGEVVQLSTRNAYEMSQYRNKHYRITDSRFKGSDFIYGTLK